MSITERFITHDVENQVPALGPCNAFLTDVALREGTAREGAAWAEADLAAFGAFAGGEMMELGFAANENKPKLKSFDRGGERLDEVDFHPAYHRLMQLGMEQLQRLNRANAGNANNVDSVDQAPPEYDHRQNLRTGFWE